MVSSIVPGVTGAGALGLEPRLVRGDAAAADKPDTPAWPGDAVQIGSGAQWANVRESVNSALTQIDLALKTGQDALSLAAKIRDASSAEPPDQDTVDTLLSQLDDTLNSAVSSGARLLAGEDLQVQAEPGAPTVRVAGFDGQLQDGPGSVFAFARDAQAGPDLAKAADASIAALQSNLTRLAGAARTLSAHQSFLGAAANVDGVRNDLDADGARLLALQVRQGLDAAGGGAIANVEPQSVLSLFRA
jgi:hypothetical protein